MFPKQRKEPARKDPLKPVITPPPAKKEMPTDQVLQAQFAKVGRLQWHIDIIIQQMTALENENKQLKKQLEETNKTNKTNQTN